MAASTDPILFPNFQVSAGGNVVEGIETLALSINENEIEVIPNTPDLNRYLCRGLVTWSVEISGMLSATSNAQCASQASLSFNNGVDTVKGLRTLNINLDREVIDITDQADALVQNILPGRISGDIGWEAVYYDPAGTGAESMQDALDSILTSTFDDLTSVIASFGTNPQTVTFAAARVPDITITRADGAEMVWSGSCMNSGAITTVTTGLATAIAAIIAAFAAGTALAVTLEPTPEVSLDTEFTGSTYCTSININVPLEGPITWTATLTGNGALTESQPA